MISRRGSLLVLELGNDTCQPQDFIRKFVVTRDVLVSTVLLQFLQIFTS